jgi:hypothetical protein
MDSNLHTSPADDADDKTMRLESADVDSEASESEVTMPISMDPSKDVEQTMAANVEGTSPEVTFADEEDFSISGKTFVDDGASSPEVDKTIPLDHLEVRDENPEIMATMRIGGGESNDDSEDFAYDRTEALNNTKPASQNISLSDERSDIEKVLNLRPQKLLDTKNYDPNSTSADDLSVTYELVNELGQGGMGKVYAARQTSLDREVAIKLVLPATPENKRQSTTQREQLKRLQKQRDQFLSEAVVTGFLDHPNIVPIHDIGVTEDNSIFYAMKKVKGVEWKSILKDKSLTENLRILLSVCDAVAFAHSRGVIHRDIKPENVMLGDFGVVMLMDWGLACKAPDKTSSRLIRSAPGLGGTPAFMPPEMVTGPISKIGCGSDIYLLGATLFQITTGHTPHRGSNSLDCLHNARENKIYNVDPKLTLAENCAKLEIDPSLGELLQVALKAMSTEPYDRYANVIDFQHAVREFLSHTESLNLANRAREDFSDARTSGDNRNFSRAVFGFEEAIALWEGNDMAQRELIEVQAVYAEHSLTKGDYDLGLSLLDEKYPRHQPVIQKLVAGKQRREQQRTRNRILSGTVVGLILLITGISTYAAYSINMQKNIAELARNDAIIARDFAEQNRVEAVKSKDAAIVAKNDAIIAKNDAIQARNDAISARMKEEQAKVQALMAKEQEVKAKDEAIVARDEARRQENIAQTARIKEAEAKSAAIYEGYLAQIGLVKKHIDDNNFKDANKTLDKLQLQPDAKDLLGWEYFYLRRQVKQGLSNEDKSKTGDDVLFLPGGNELLASLDGHIVSIPINASGQLDWKARHDVKLETDQVVRKIAISPEGKMLAVSLNELLVELVPLQQQSDLRLTNGPDSIITIKTARDTRVTSLSFLSETFLAVGYDDRTLRVFQVDSGRGEQVCVAYHQYPVEKVRGVQTGPQKFQIISATSDDRSGRAAVWNMTYQPAGWAIHLQGEMTEHHVPVTAVAVTRDGKYAASADQSGRVLFWETQNARMVDYRRSTEEALQKLKNPGSTAQIPETRSMEYRELFDRTVREGDYVNRTRKAHDDQVNELNFDPTGHQLITTGADRTIKVWELPAAQLLQTHRGHGSEILTAQFSPADENVIVSLSESGELRTWSQLQQSGVIDYTVNPTRENEVQAHRDLIRSAHFDKTGNKIVTTSRDRTARVLDIDPVNLRIKSAHTFGSENAPKSGELKEGTLFISLPMILDQKRNHLIIGGADSMVRIWNIDAGVSVAEIPGTGFNRDLAISPQGRLLLTNYDHPTAPVAVWQLSEQGLPAEHPQLLLENKLKPELNHHASVTTIAISDDERYAYTGDEDGKAFIWDLQSNPLQNQSSTLHNGYLINDAKFLPGTHQVAICSDQQTVTIWDIDLNKDKAILHVSGYVNSISISSDGKQMVAISENDQDRKQTIMELYHWNLEHLDQEPEILSKMIIRKGTGIPTPVEQQLRMESVSFSRTPHDFVVAYGTPDRSRGYLEVWNSTVKTPAKIVRKFQFPTGMKSPSSDSAILSQSDDKMRVYSLHGDEAYSWDIESLKQLKSFRSQGTVNDACFTPDGKYVITASGSIKIWDLKNNQAIDKLEAPHTSGVNALAALKQTGDVYQILTAGDDGYVKIWEWNHHAPEKHFQLLEEFDCRGMGEKPASVNAIHLDRDQQIIVVACSDGYAKVLKRGQSKPVCMMNDVDGEDVSLLCVRVSPDGQWILAGGSDRIARMWRLKNNESRTQPEYVFQGHGDQVEGVDFVPDHMLRIVTASRDHTVKIWDPVGIQKPEGHAMRIQGRELLSLERHLKGVSAVESSPNGKTLLSAGLDGRIILWPAGGGE